MDKLIKKVERIGGVKETIGKTGNKVENLGVIMKIRIKTLKKANNYLDKSIGLLMGKIK